jgi:hypothetical protein
MVWASNLDNALEAIFDFHERQIQAAQVRIIIITVEHLETTTATYPAVAMRRS